MRRASQSIVGLLRPHMGPFRLFWNPFHSQRKEGDGHRRYGAVEPESAQKVRELAEDVLQNNERVVDASLDILKWNVDLLLADDEHAVLSDVIGMLFFESYRSPSEQYDATYRALCLPVSQRTPELKSALLVVLEYLLPTPFFGIFRETGDALFMELTTDEQKLLWRGTVHLFLGDFTEFEANHANFAEISCDGEVNVTELLLRLEGIIPTLATSPSFVQVKESSEQLLLKARLFDLLTRLCKMFDTAGNGLIQLSEFKDSLVNVVGQAEADAMLQGVAPDKDGCVRYFHVTSLLTRPR
jgi:hypothetical protein